MIRPAGIDPDIEGLIPALDACSSFEDPAGNLHCSDQLKVRWTRPSSSLAT